MLRGSYFSNLKLCFSMKSNRPTASACAPAATITRRPTTTRVMGPGLLVWLALGDSSVIEIKPLLTKKPVAAAA
jgi:hypothetical protein